MLEQLAYGNKIWKRQIFDCHSLVLFSTDISVINRYFKLNYGKWNWYNVPSDLLVFRWVRTSFRDKCIILLMLYEINLKQSIFCARKIFSFSIWDWVCFHDSVNLLFIEVLLIYFTRGEPQQRFYLYLWFF